MGRDVDRAALMRHLLRVRHMELRLARASLSQAATAWREARREAEDLETQLRTLKQGMPNNLEEVVARAKTTFTVATHLRMVAEAQESAAQTLQLAAKAKRRAEAKKERVEHCIRVQQRTQRERAWERYRQEGIAAASMW